MKANIYCAWEHVMHGESVLLAVFSCYDKAADYIGQFEPDEEYRVWYRIEILELDKEEIDSDPSQKEKEQRDFDEAYHQSFQKEKEMPNE